MCIGSSIQIHLQAVQAVQAVWPDEGLRHQEPPLSNIKHYHIWVFLRCCRCLCAPSLSFSQERCQFKTFLLYRQVGHRPQSWHARALKVLVSPKDPSTQSDGGATLWHYDSKSEHRFHGTTIRNHTTTICKWKIMKASARCFPFWIKVANSQPTPNSRPNGMKCLSIMPMWTPLVTKSITNWSWESLTASFISTFTACSSKFTDAEGTSQKKTSAKHGFVSTITQRIQPRYAS